MFQMITKCFGCINMNGNGDENDNKDKNDDGGD